MSFYNGLENILKRVAIFEGTEIPGGPNWHVEFFSMFVEGDSPTGVPVLFSRTEAEPLREYRSFRHVMVHGYCVTLRWELMSHLVDSIETVFDLVTTAVDRYLESP